MIVSQDRSPPGQCNSDRGHLHYHNDPEHCEVLVCFTCSILSVDFYVFAIHAAFLLQVSSDFSDEKMRGESRTPLHPTEGKKIIVE